MSVELLRIATSILWTVILFAFRRPAWRAARWAADLAPWEALMGATWILALNRLTYSAVAQWLPTDDDAFNVCQIFALFAGMLMILAGLWALRVHRR